VRQVVAASSYFVLGIGFRVSGRSFIPDYLPMDENHSCKPEDTYSLSKVLGEEIQMAYARAYGIRSVALRLMGVFYPDSEMHRKVYQFNLDVPRRTDAEKAWMDNTTFQYVDARDVARVVELSIEAQGLEPFEAFYIATDTMYAQPTVEIIAHHWPGLKEKGAGIKGTDGVISIEKARTKLKYEPRFSWRNGA
jgi:nucleoside-diphosphate-sugar epimerase